MNVLSLFDGMSCGRVALERVGIEVNNYYAAEIDKYAIKVSQANYPNIVQLGDINNWEKWDVDWSSIDLLIAGFPCQAWSMAGKQKGDKDPRGALVHTLTAIHLKINFSRYNAYKDPVKFMFENVKMKKSFMKYINGLFGVEPVLINSALVSAQNRQRYYWTNIGKIDQPEDQCILLKDIIETEPNEITIMSKNFTDRNAHILRDDFDGKAKNLSAMEYVKNGRQGDYIRCGAMRGRYLIDGKRQDHKMKTAGLTEQRLEIRTDEKTNTLTTVQKDNYVVFNDDPVLYRKLTPIECERLQTVPDNYTNHVSNTQRYKMIGNGWTVDVIAHIFKGLNTQVSFL